ncbi:hypothetical protein ACJMK2_004845 [Sinanodonta woodiana]|uniref:Receptor expression-enhancing protein n=1 Tax=Sinanodonta woodiana TaxID=1069815 RepID=A0ABD3VNI6_SINWO
MVSAVLSRIVILVFGTLYPAYASYKAIRTRNIKEYVKWMMYWIVFALFCSVETFSDVLLSWLPFYYEVKIVFVFWLLSPVTRGSSFLYKKFVHPSLVKREKEIDECIVQARTKGYSTLLTLGHRGLTYATNVVVTTAIKGQSTLVEHIKKSYSTNDLRVKDGTGSTIEDRVDSFIDDEDELDNRLMEDNMELDRRKERHAALSRSSSDISDIRPSHRKRIGVPKDTGLGSVEEDPEEEVTVTTEEYTYVSPRRGGPGFYTKKEIKGDPYGTMPRTRTRTRAKLQQH